MKKLTKIFTAVLVNTVVATTGTAFGESIPAAPAFSPKDWCEPIGPKHNEGPAAHYFTEAYVAENLRQEQFGELARKVEAWKKPGCVWDDGRPRMSALLWGYEQAFDRNTDWSIHANRIENLKKAFPNTDFAAVAEAEYWNQYAWNARGSGFASSVTPDGWKLFRERLEKAENVLITSQNYASELPSWYVEMINVQKYLGRPDDQVGKIFLEGATKFKTFFPIYAAMSQFMLPKWGGSWEAYENFAKWSVKNTMATEGDSLYARLYWYAGSEVYQGEDLFKVTKASWPKMRKGFEDMMKIYPKSIWNLNNFAAFACRANDKTTFLATRKKIGTNTIEQAWQNDYSLDLCDHKFGYAIGALGK